MTMEKASPKVHEGQSTKYQIGFSGHWESNDVVLAAAADQPTTFFPTIMNQSTCLHNVRWEIRSDLIRVR